MADDGKATMTEAQFMVFAKRAYRGYIEYLGAMGQMTLDEQCFEKLPASIQHAWKESAKAVLWRARFPVPGEETVCP